MKYTSVILIISTVIIFAACNPNKKQKITVKDFSLVELNMLTNYPEKVIYMDYTDAMNGFVVPSVSQTKNGMFDLDFTLKNESKSDKTLYYKIYYQNESYKFPESDPKTPSIQNEFAHENFYGSWEDTDIGFKKIGQVKSGEEIIVNDNFRILGNPRNDEMYFFEGINDRWKRNPRVGDYSVLIVVVDEATLKKIPDYVKNIKLKNGDKFISPYYYFLYGEGSKFDNCLVSKSENVIKLKAAPDLGNGVYIDKRKFKNNSVKDFDKYYYCNCGDDDNLFQNAAIEQFIHYIDESSKFNNVPVIEDFFGGNFTQEEYNWLRAFYPMSDRITVLPQTAHYPCETIKSDSIENKIVIRNPKTEYGKWQKQNVGMITRHGFTYGKYTVKVKLTELLNEDQVWNGITNAIWMIYQGGRGQNETGWNLRRPCREKGYMATYWGGRNDERVERVAYSEIDFEILKTVPYCPAEKFPPVYNNYEAKTNKVKAWNVNLPGDVKRDEGKIAVCCTNWDMACWEPKNFSAGCHTVDHNGKTYYAHRWEDGYRAVTTKYMVSDDELFAGDYYYFQIDWQPDKIIWRIGPQKNKLYEVGYIDNTISMIPDNQMLLIVTQEFHNTDWWPGSPYEQANIPFPGEDYVGEIYEITIE
jgi:hypothetical protein